LPTSPFTPPNAEKFLTSNLFEYNILKCFMFSQNSTLRTIFLLEYFHHILKNALKNAWQFFPVVTVINPEESGAYRERWSVDSPGADLPQSFVVRNQTWWFACTEQRSDNSGFDLIYHGPILGQLIRVHPPGANGQHRVDLTDPLWNDGTETSGTISDARGSIRFRDGTLAYSGNDHGYRAVIQHQDQLTLHTIDGDLDILGNHLSFGLLRGDASLAGTLLRFEDSLSGGAVLHTGLSRNNAKWMWWHLVDDGSNQSEPVMELSTSTGLRLHDPTAAGSTSGITLNPAEGAASSISGTLRVRPGGDLSMGIFQAGGQP
jgi:hypothetical protein